MEIIWEDAQPARPRSAQNWSISLVCSIARKPGGVRRVVTLAAGTPTSLTVVGKRFAARHAQFAAGEFRPCAYYVGPISTLNNLNRAETQSARQPSTGSRSGRWSGPTAPRSSPRVPCRRHSCGPPTATHHEIAPCHHLPPLCALFPPPLRGMIPQRHTAPETTRAVSHIPSDLSTPPFRQQAQPAIIL